MKNEGEHLIVFDGVYPPSEDSYLLLDSLELNEKDIVLEVGSGSGVITIDLLKRVSRVVSIDIAMSAVRNTMENIRRHGLGHVGAVIQTDLISAISPDAEFSVIVFNPPYLPVDEHTTDMDQALVGGKRGNEVILRFLSHASRHLKLNGRTYVVMSSLSNPDTVQEYMEKLGFTVDVPATKVQFFERLLVIRGTLRHKEIVL